MSINWRSAHTVGVLMTVLLATLGGSAGPVSAKAKRHPRHKVRHLHQSAKPKHGGRKAGSVVHGTPAYSLIRLFCL